MKKSKKIILLILLLVLISFLVRVIYKNTYNWDSDVQSYLNRYSIRTQFIESYKDPTSNSIIYKYQTYDDLQVSFEVKCYWGNLTTPFGFNLPISTKKINDNLGQQVCTYISENKGTYNIENKSIDEISTYILEVVKDTEEILYQYGLEYIVPSISFILVNDEEIYEFDCSNINESILQDRLTELLYM